MDKDGVHYEYHTENKMEKKTIEKKKIFLFVCKKR